MLIEFLIACRAHRYRDWLEKKGQLKKLARLRKALAAVEVYSFRCGFCGRLSGGFNTAGTSIPSQ